MKKHITFFDQFADQIANPKSVQAIADFKRIDYNEAQDCIQEALLSTWNQHGANPLASKDKIKSSFYSFLEKRRIDSFRKKQTRSKNEPESFDDKAKLDGEEETSDVDVRENTESTKRFRQEEGKMDILDAYRIALNRLPSDEHRQAITDKEFGYTSEETAERLGKSLSGFYKIYDKAKNGLKKNMPDFDDSAYSITVSTGITSAPVFNILVGCL